MIFSFPLKDLTGSYIPKVISLSLFFKLQSFNPDFHKALVPAIPETASSHLAAKVTAKSKTTTRAKE